MSSSGCKSPSASNLASATSTSVRRTSIGLLSRSGLLHRSSSRSSVAHWRCREAPDPASGLTLSRLPVRLHDHSHEVCPPPPPDRLFPTSPCVAVHRPPAVIEGGPQLAIRPSSEVTCQLAKEESGEVRRFLAQEWPAADRAIFGEDCDWTSR